MLKMAGFNREFVAGAELTLLGWRATRLCQAVCGARSRWRSFEGRRVEKRGLGIPKLALLDGTVISHAMST